MLFLVIGEIGLEILSEVNGKLPHEVDEFQPLNDLQWWIIPNWYTSDDENRGLEQMASEEAKTHTTRCLDRLVNLCPKSWS